MTERFTPSTRATLLFCPDDDTLSGGTGGPADSNDGGGNGDRQILRILAVGPLKAVNHHVMQMYRLGYAEPGEWSRPLPTVNANEVMRILTKRIMGLNQ